MLTQSVRALESCSQNTYHHENSGVRPVWILLFIIAAVIALRWPILFSGLQSYGGDTVKWAGPAINFARHGFSALDYLPTTSFGIYDVEVGGRTQYLTWPFPPSYMLSAFVRTFGESNWTLRLLPLLLNLVASVYLYLFVARAFKNDWWGVFGASCFLFLPAEIYYSMQVSDTQFWLLGSFAGFYHMIQWHGSRRKYDFIATIFWFLFASASSWFGYLATTAAMLFMLTHVFMDKRQPRWIGILQSPLPWIIMGTAVLVTVHAALLFNSLGLQGFISIYGAKWQTYTGGNIVAQNVPNANWWQGAWEAALFRVKMIVSKSLGEQIPLFASVPITIISGLFLILFIARARVGLERELHRACGSILIFFGLFYGIYVLVFPTHMTRATHNFTTQMLAPVFVVLLVYGTRWIWVKLDTKAIPDFIKYLPIVTISTLLLAVSIHYKSDDPTLSQNRTDMIEAARLFGTTLTDKTRPDDLVLSNHQGWNYDNNIMKFTAQRTVKLTLFDIEKIQSYANDSRFRGVVFIYRDRRPYEPKSPFKKLAGYLTSSAKSATPLNDPDYYPSLTLYRLK